MLILMVMVSPLVWEHHPVLLALSYVAVATVLKPADWPLFGLAYFLEFLMPTFDFYPWSYGRLISPLILLFLAWRRRADGQSAAFDAANRWLTMPAPPPLDESTPRPEQAAKYRAESTAPDAANPPR